MKRKDIFTLETTFLGHPASTNFETCPVVKIEYQPNGSDPFVVKTRRFPNKVDATRRFYLLSDAVAYANSIRGA